MTDEMRRVHPGAICTPIGGLGATDKGTIMVCRLNPDNPPKDGRARWGRRDPIEPPKRRRRGTPRKGQGLEKRYVDKYAESAPEADAPLPQQLLDQLNDRQIGALQAAGGQPYSGKPRKTDVEKLTRAGLLNGDGNLTARGAGVLRRLGENLHGHPAKDNSGSADTAAPADRSAGAGTDWSRYDACTTCPAVAGAPCHDLGSPGSLNATPHDGRPAIKESTGQSPETVGQSLNDRISDAYWSLARRSHQPVRLAQLRKSLNDVDPTDLDAALVRLYRSQQINLTREENQGVLTDADRAAATDVGGQPKHNLSMAAPADRSAAAGTDWSKYGACGTCPAAAGQPCHDLGSPGSLNATAHDGRPLTTSVEPHHTVVAAHTITDQYGREWTRMPGGDDDMYIHDGLLAHSADRIPHLDLPSPSLADHPGYAGLCSTCRSRWPVSTATPSEPPAEAPAATPDPDGEAGQAPADDHIPNASERKYAALRKSAAEGPSLTQMLAADRPADTPPPPPRTVEQAQTDIAEAAGLSPRARHTMLMMLANGHQATSPAAADAYRAAAQAAGEEADGRQAAVFAAGFAGRSKHDSPTPVDRSAAAGTDWSKYGACGTCPAAAGQPCHDLGSPGSLNATAHDGRPLTTSVEPSVEPPPAATPGPDVEQAIRDAYRQVLDDRAVDDDHGYVMLSDVRGVLGDRFDRAAVDHTLDKMITQPNVRIQAEMNQRALTDADRAAAVRIGDEDRHVIRIPQDRSRDAGTDWARYGECPACYAEPGQPCRDRRNPDDLISTPHDGRPVVRQPVEQVASDPIHHTAPEPNNWDFGDADNDPPAPAVYDTSHIPDPAFSDLVPEEDPDALVEQLPVWAQRRIDRDAAGNPDRAAQLAQDFLIRQRAVDQGLPNASEDDLLTLANDQLPDLASAARVELGGRRAKARPDFAGPPVGGAHSAAPATQNGWGYNGDQPVAYHADGPVGTAVKYMGDDRLIDVDGLPLGEQLGRIATDVVKGRRSAADGVAAYKAIRDRLPAGSRAQQWLSQVVANADGPMIPVPDVPAAAPAPLRRLVGDLYAIPACRGRWQHELDQAAEIARAAATGSLSGRRLTDELDRMYGSHHESYGDIGKMEFDRAVRRAKGEMQQWAAFERQRRSAS